MAKKAEQAFAVWFETGSIKQASEEIGLPESTISFWKLNHGWDERRVAVRNKVSEAVDEKLIDIASRVAEQVPKMLELLEKRLAEADAGTVKDIASAYKMLAETYQLVAGEPTSISDERQTIQTVDMNKLNDAFNKVILQQSQIVVSAEEEDAIASPMEEQKQEIQQALSDQGVELQAEGADIGEKL